MKISVVPADIAELLPRLAKGQAATWRMDFGGEATDWHTLDHPVHEQPQRGGRWGWYKRSRTLLVPLHPYTLSDVRMEYLPQRFGAQHALTAMAQALGDLPGKPTELIVVQSAVFRRPPPENGAVIFAGVAVRVPRS